MYARGGGVGGPEMLMIAYVGEGGGLAKEYVRNRSLIVLFQSDWNDV